MRFVDASSSAGPGTRASLLDALAEECTVLDRWPESATHRLEAIALWHDLGQRRHEGDSTRRLAHVQSGVAARGSASTAIGLLQPLGPTPSWRGRTPRRPGWR